MQKYRKIFKQKQCVKNILPSPDPGNIYAAICHQILGECLCYPCLAATARRSKHDCGHDTIGFMPINKERKYLLYVLLTNDVGEIISFHRLYVIFFYQSSCTDTGTGCSTLTSTGLVGARTFLGVPLTISPPRPSDSANLRDTTTCISSRNKPFSCFSGILQRKQHLSFYLTLFCESYRLCLLPYSNYEGCPEIKQGFF